MKIVLKDGTEIQNAMVGKVNNLIELTMSKSDAVENFAKFMNPEIMSGIDYYSGIWKTTYSGFSRLERVDNPKEDEMRVWMEGAPDSISVGDPVPLVDPMYIPDGMNL